MRWYQYTKSQLAGELSTDLERGLGASEAAARLARHGPNVLPEEPGEPLWRIFFRQFGSPLIYVLVACAAVVWYLGDEADAAIIAVVLLFNAGIGAVQEGRSQRTLSELKKLSAVEAGVVRGGVEEVVPEREVVVGDILSLSEGQKVVADARVVTAASLGVDEAALTGESGAVLKHDGPISEPDLPVHRQHNVVFKGTNVLTGAGRAVVVATGLATEIGKISRALKLPEEEIPLQKNIRALSGVIIRAVAVLSLALFLVGVYAGREVREVFAVVVSLAVSVIPEGLPLVLTLILVTGVWRMSRRRALVKKMQAVESLGRADIIAVDKTGTITRNEMVVRSLYLGRSIYHVTGNGYEPKGSVSRGSEPAAANPDVIQASKLASLATRATARYSEAEDRFQVLGDPTEAALSVFGEKLGADRASLLSRYREVGEVPFDYKTKYRAVFYEHRDEFFCAVAGAPEVVMERSGTYLEGGQHHALTAQDRARITAAQEEFSTRGLRVLAVAMRRLPRREAFDRIADLTFVGLFGIEDSVRPEAIAAVRRAQAAGVKVVMITGDHRHTARAVAREAGIYREGDEVVADGDLSGLSSPHFADRLQKVSVFARVTPEDKMHIIRAYKRAGLIVAMTGDGVNDAPSLVAADLGVAMGKGGTEVAKEAADIVLLDDNLSSIVAAVEEGRVMYRNIQKSLLFLFSTSFGELLTIAVALVADLPLPILAVQVLWLNLVTDPLIGMALALDGQERASLREKPRAFPKYFVDGTMLGQMLVVGAVMAIGSLYVFNLTAPVSYAYATTACLTVLAVFQWYNAFSCSQAGSRSVLSRATFHNRYLLLALAGNVALQLLAVYLPPLQRVLKTVPLSWQDWALVLGIGVLVLAAEELRRYLARAVKGSPARLPDRAATPSH